MRRALITLLFSIALATATMAQTTTVTLNTLDGDAQAWNNGTWNATLIPASNAITGPFLIKGTTLTVPNQIQSGSLSGTGSATISLADNILGVSPAGTVWQLTVCPNATTSCFTQNVTITGATQTVTLTPPPIRIVLTGVPYRVLAYLDAEIANPVAGSLYYNVTAACEKLYTTVWTCLGGGGSGTVTQINSGTGLTGGPITGTGTLSILGAFQLPQGCPNGNFPQWNGAAWVCNAGGGLPNGTQGLPVVNTTGSNLYATSPVYWDASQFTGADICAQIAAAATAQQSLNFNQVLVVWPTSGQFNCTASPFSTWHTGGELWFTGQVDIRTAVPWIVPGGVTLHGNGPSGTVTASNGPSSGPDKHNPNYYNFILRACNPKIYTCPTEFAVPNEAIPNLSGACSGANTQSSICVSGTTAFINVTNTAHVGQKIAVSNTANNSLGVTGQFYGGPVTARTASQIQINVPAGTPTCTTTCGTVWEGTPVVTNAFTTFRTAVHDMSIDGGFVFGDMPFANSSGQEQTTYYNINTTGSGLIELAHITTTGGAYIGGASVHSGPYHDFSATIGPVTCEQTGGTNNCFSSLTAVTPPSPCTANLTNTGNGTGCSLTPFLASYPATSLNSAALNPYGCDSEALRIDGNAAGGPFFGFTGFTLNTGVGSASVPPTMNNATCSGHAPVGIFVQDETQIHDFHIEWWLQPILIGGNIAINPDWANIASNNIKIDTTETCCGGGTNAAVEVGPGSQSITVLNVDANTNHAYHDAVSATTCADTNVAEFFLGQNANSLQTTCSGQTNNFPAAVNAGTGFSIGGTATLGHCLVGNGSNLYVDAACPGGGASTFDSTSIDQPAATASWTFPNSAWQFALAGTAPASSGSTPGTNGTTVAQFTGPAGGASSATNGVGGIGAPGLTVAGGNGGASNGGTSSAAQGGNAITATAGAYGSGKGSGVLTMTGAAFFGQYAGSGLDASDNCFNFHNQTNFCNLLLLKNPFTATHLHPGQIESADFQYNAMQGSSPVSTLTHNNEYLYPCKPANGGGSQLDTADNAVPCHEWNISFDGNPAGSNTFRMFEFGFLSSVDSSTAGTILYQGGAALGLLGAPSVNLGSNCTANTPDIGFVQNGSLTNTWASIFTGTVIAGWGSDGCASNGGIVTTLMLTNELANHSGSTIVNGALVKLDTANNSSITPITSQSDPIAGILFQTACTNGTTGCDVSAGAGIAATELLLGAGTCAIGQDVIPDATNPSTRVDCVNHGTGGTATVVGYCMKAQSTIGQAVITYVLGTTSLPGQFVNTITATAPLNASAASGAVTLALKNSTPANITALTGTDTLVPTNSGAFTNGDSVVGDAQGGIKDSGVAVPAGCTASECSWVVGAPGISPGQNVGTGVAYGNVVLNTHWMKFHNDITRKLGTTCLLGIQTTSNTNNIHAGVYSISGTTATLVWDCGKMTLGATAGQLSNTSVTAFTLAPGDYYLASCVDIITVLVPYVLYDTTAAITGASTFAGGSNSSHDVGVDATDVCTASATALPTPVTTTNIAFTRNTTVVDIPYVVSVNP